MPRRVLVSNEWPFKIPGKINMRARAVIPSVDVIPWIHPWKEMRLMMRSKLMTLESHKSRKRLITMIVFPAALVVSWHVAVDSFADAGVSACPFVPWHKKPEKFVYWYRLDTNESTLSPISHLMSITMILWI
jgi:hypothetical protein